MYYNGDEQGGGACCLSKEIKERIECLRKSRK